MTEFTAPATDKNIFYNTGILEEDSDHRSTVRRGEWYERGYVKCKKRGNRKWTTSKEREKMSFANTS